MLESTGMESLWPKPARLKERLGARSRSNFGRDILRKVRDAIVTGAVAMAIGFAPAGLATAMGREARVVECAKDAKTPLREWISHAFTLRQVTLRSGEAMTAAIGNEGCMAVGQSATVFIYERTSHGYRKVLDSVALSDFVEISNDGTAVLPTHQTMQTIFESTYVWNGGAYVFSALRSHLYDVSLGERRPYEVRLHFAPGNSATTVSGHVALNFGQTYTFNARAGQRLTLDVLKFKGRRPTIALYYGEDKMLGASDARKWSGKLSQTGVYALVVLPYNESDESRVSTYSIRVTIR